MITLKLAELEKILSVSPSNTNTEFQGISIDSRKIAPKNLFVAIRGENFDGHDFVENAYKQGATAALVDRELPCTIPQIKVPDTKLALGKIGRAWRERYALPLAGVTGSNGKTTLKNMIAHICIAACQNDKTKVLATHGNFNNDIGLPLNLVRLNEQHKYAVIEMGMNHPGEIAYLTQLAKPTVAVINNAAGAHLEGVKNLEGVAKAKGEIFLGLAPNGIGVLNADDHFFKFWQGLLGQRSFISFGLDHPADVTAKIHNMQETPSFTLCTPKGEIPITLHLHGKHNIMNALAASAVAIALNIDLTAIKTGLENVRPVPGRLQQYSLPNGTRVINDTYNANPASLQAAIDVLAHLPGRKILVLGDMKEIGSETKQLHYNMGEQARVSGIDYLFTVGELAAEAAKGFGTGARTFPNKSQLADALKLLLQPDVNILVKGSRSMQMEKVVAELLPADMMADSSH